MWHFFPAFFLYQPTLTDKHSSASPRPQRNHNSSLCLLFTNLSVCPEIFSWIAWPLRDKWALVWLSCTKIGQNRSVKMRTREWLVLNYPCTLLFLKEHYYIYFYYYFFYYSVTYLFLNSLMDECLPYQGDVDLHSFFSGNSGSGFMFLEFLICCSIYL